MSKKPLLENEIDFTTPTDKSISKVVSEFSKGGKIQVWIIDKRELGDIEPYLKYLSKEESIKAQKFRFEKDFSTFVVARGVLRKLLSKYMQKPIDSIDFAYGDYGKPILKNSDSIKFNVSHSKELIVLAFTPDIAIGVDVEYWNDTINFWEIANTVFTKTEIAFLNALQGKDLSRGFYHLWTRKEAFIKLSGYGLSMPIALTKISVLKSKVQLLEQENANKRFFNWDCELKSFTPESGYSAAVTTQKNISELQILKWTDYKGNFEMG